jgi:[glutamine synthetase] adenylyltransferase / [glutamine synthetase]-adenylyl-L-tyrosine phosphorylase
MTSGWFLAYHEIPEMVRRWLAGLGVRDPERGARDLADLTRRAGPERLERVSRIAVQLDAILPRCPDPGMALTNLDRFLAAVPRLDETLDELAADARTTEILLQVFSTSQHYGEVLIRDPELFDWLRAGAERRDRAVLVEGLWGAIAALSAEDEQKLALRRFRQRESLRIGYNDIVLGFPLEVITQDLSHLADACVEAAVRMARAHAEARFGVPTTPRGAPARFVVLGLGKLGGEELNYSSDIDLIFLYDDEGQTTGPKVVSNAELFARMGSEIVRLLHEHTAMGMAYRVDMRLRPDGEQGAMARSLGSTMGYYVTRGRTWERQALIKCRPIAGDLALGRTFLEAITPFVYRRYLAATEIAEIKALKRRIEQRTVSAGTAEVEVKTGRGGIRDVEFVVQFLQLLHGGEYPEVRGGNTLHAIAQLERVGCLSAEERYIMDDTYRFLRRVEHRLQIVFDRQTHEMPREMESVRTLALRMGYAPASDWESRSGPATRFLADYRGKTELNRRILNHLLHDAFRGDDGAAVDPIVDLVLDPDPAPELISEVLGAYPFRDRGTAHQNLLALAREDFPFLSQARCRHFLAAIAPRLLEAVGRSPDPDMTLTNLEKVSASLGAKAVLWELFNFNPPSLRLYVELCATSQFLSEILINNPGMIDDLVDSLVVDRPSSGKAIKEELEELCEGAEDPYPIIWSFRNKEWIRIGTRDILGREPVREVTRELADVAEAVLTQVASDQWDRRALRYGTPRSSVRRRHDHWAILGLGKCGGRELNYHSDLDLVFLHESDGMTAGGPKSIPNNQFVTEVVQRVLKALGNGSSAGALYAVDARLRPHGASGPLVMTLDAFRDYLDRSTQPWERMAFTRARVVFATGGFGRRVTEAIRAMLSAPNDPVQLAGQALAMRRRLESSRPRQHLKRGFGGVADIEFIVQYLQLVHAASQPELLRPNLWDALDALRRHGIIDPATHTELRDAYDFLRAVEGRLRLIQNRNVGALPEASADLERLARRLNYDPADSARSVAAFLADLERLTRRTRAIFDRIITSQAQAGRPAAVNPG